MLFKDYLATFPAIDLLSGLNVANENGEIIHHIPALEGKLGSLKLYNALAIKFNGILDEKAAEQGLKWFAEYLNEALEKPGSHPNIDLLLKVKAEKHSYQLIPVMR